MSEKFGRYQLLTRIGSGGMAEVFRARLEAPGGVEKILVIKRIRPSLHEEPAFLRLFVDEARIALPLSHENITTVFEFGEVDGQYFLAMEHIHGQNLGAVLRLARLGHEKLPPALALFVAAEVAKGLAYAHDALSPEGEPLNVVHLDVSPQNILLSYDGAVKLTDFGIAKVLRGASAAKSGRSAAGHGGGGRSAFRAGHGSGDRSFDQEEARAAQNRSSDAGAAGGPFTAPIDEGLGPRPNDGVAGSDRSAGSGGSDQLLGKASYLAPEQVRREAVDGRTDIYALGCVLYEALVGEPPHGRGADREVLARVNDGSYRLPSQVNPALAPFDTLLSRALAPNPAERYASAAEFHLALSRSLNQIAPGTDSPQLAAWMRAAFADELRPTGQLAERRAHILAQLEAAGFQAEGDETVELLDSATVALPGVPELPKAERRSRRRKGLAIGGALLLLAGVGGALFQVLNPPLAPAQASTIPAVAATASISLHSWPSANVEIDGVLQSGRTPLDLELPAGVHQVVFTHPTLDLRREIELQLAAGDQRTVVVTLGR